MVNSLEYYSEGRQLERQRLEHTNTPDGTDDIHLLKHIITDDFETKAQSSQRKISEEQKK